MNLVAGTFHVFVNSTCDDLVAERDVLQLGIERVGHIVGGRLRAAAPPLRVARDALCRPAPWSDSSRSRGYEVNLYAVPDHVSFLQAVLLVPGRSPLTSTSRSGTTTGGARVSGGGTIATRAASQLQLPEHSQPRDGRLDALTKHACRAG